jgi:hypothetical protein
MNEYGAVYFTASTTPFTATSTFPTPVASVTVAVRSPSCAGPVKETDGAVVSGHDASEPSRAAFAASRMAPSDDFGWPLA